MNLYANWSEFSQKVIEHAKKSKDKNVKQYLSIYDEAIDEGKKNCHLSSKCHCFVSEVFSS